jgi:hypothetical protein
MVVLQVVQARPRRPPPRLGSRRDESRNRSQCQPSSSNESGADPPGARPLGLGVGSVRGGPAAGGSGPAGGSGLSGGRAAAALGRRVPSCDEEMDSVQERASESVS